MSPNPDTRDSTEVGRSDLSLCTLVLTIPRSQICHSLDGEIWEVLWGHCAIFGHNTSESDIGRWTFEAREIHRWGNLWGNRERAMSGQEKTDVILSREQYVTDTSPF